MNTLQAIDSTRKIDELGRVVLPSKTRKFLGINPGDSIEISVDIKNRVLVLEPINSNCTFCGTEYSLMSFGRHNICDNCINTNIPPVG